MSMHTDSEEEEEAGGSADAGDGTAAGAAAATTTPDEGAPAPSLIALPDQALVAILERLYDPLPLGLTCRHTASLLRSAALPWLARFGACAAPWRSLPGRVLTFRPFCKVLTPRELAAALLQYTDAVGDVPDAVQAARAALRAEQDPLDVLCMLCPHADVLLLPYLAAGGHTELAAQAAMRMRNGSAGSTNASGTRSSTSRTSNSSQACMVRPLHAAHPELGTMHVVRAALFTALRARSWGTADALLRVLRQPAIQAAVSGSESSSSSGGDSSSLDEGSASASAGVSMSFEAEVEAAELADVLRGAEEVAARAGCDPALLSALLSVTDPDAGRGQYLLVAAAGSGRLATLQAALWALSSAPDAPRGVLCQLPQALCAAGRGGHVDVVEVLLRNEHMSSRPLEIATLDAAKHGWPAAAVRPVAAAIARRFREEALRMLAEPMEAALAAGHGQVASVLWEVMVQGKPEPERLVRLLMRLASEGDYARALWIADAAPRVMVKVGTAPATTAAERGHHRVADLMAERAGRPLPGGRAAAARGRLSEAVRRGDTAAAAQLLSEITLGPGALRSDLICGAAAAGDLPMLELLLERLGPWMGEEVEMVLTLTRHGHWQLVPKMHAAAAAAGARGGPLGTRGELARKLLRAVCVLCGAWREPHVGLMLWALQTTTNPAALDLMVSECTEALAATTAMSYLGALVAPAPESLLALTPSVVAVWTEVLGRLAAGSWQSDEGLGCDDGSSGAQAGPSTRWAESREGHLGAQHDTLQQHSGHWVARSDAVHQGAAHRMARSDTQRRKWQSSSSGHALVPRGAVRFTRRLAQTVALAGDPDFLYQALLYIDRHEAEIEIC